MPELTSLPPAYEALLDDARSEAKRTLDDDVGLVHLAIVLARRTPEAIDEAYGEGAAARLISRPPSIRPDQGTESLLGFLRAKAEAELRRVAGRPSLSPDVADIVGRSLA